MCGLCGIVGMGDHPPVNSDLLARMNRALHHRGPDDGGAFHEGGTGLAMRRLAIIDVAGGQQPITTPDGRYTIVYNGEVYNYRELRAELEGLGHRFRTHSDTETVLAAYAAWGPDCLHRFNGMWALAIWDRETRRLFAARDRLGIKPLYYWHGEDGSLRLASELKCFLQDPAFPRRIDEIAISHYLTYLCIPSPRTIFAAVRRLPPGHRMVWAEGELSLERYWSLDFTRKRTDLSEREAIAETRRLVAAAVERRLISEVPLGAFLSGGVDSSAVVAVMAQVMDQPVKTFSVGFEQCPPRYNELPFAQMVADRYQTDHHTLAIEPDVVDLLPKLLWFFEEPFATASAIPTLLISEWARREVTVMLSGDGGDEVFAGYPWNNFERWTRRWRRWPGALRAGLAPGLLSRLPRHTRSAPANFFRRLEKFVTAANLPPAERRVAWSYFYQEADKAALFAPAVWERVRAAPAWGVVAAVMERSTAGHFLDQMMDVDLQTYLPNENLLKVDRMTMAASIEDRVPLLDHEVVEFVASLPPAYRLPHGKLKHLLKQAFRADLPPEVLFRKKWGFILPMDAWLRGPLKGIVQTVLAPGAVERRGLFQPAAVQAVLADHLSGRRNLGHHLWQLLVLELWFRLYLDQKITDRPTCSLQELVA